MAYLRDTYQRIVELIFSRTEEKTKPSKCCCGGKCLGQNKGGEDREPEQLHVNPYAPIQEDILVVKKPKISADRRKRNYSKFDR